MENEAAGNGSLEIRPFAISDAAETLDVFLRAVRITAAAHYSAAQVAAWASSDIDLSTWSERRAAANTVVATVARPIAGFTDVSASGHIDMMFVDPAHGRRGVATALLRWALATAEQKGIATLTTYASITARPFFEAQGFSVVEQRRPEVRGVALTNYAMSRAV